MSVDVAVIWAVVALVTVWRVECAFDRWLDQRTADPLPAKEQPAIPDDLDALALSESEKHAQESVREAIREAWDRYHDWNKVRAALGVGRVE